MNSIFDTIKNRRSVRTFDGRKMDGETIAHIKEICSKTINPFGKKVDFLVLDKEEYGLGSSVINGETAYLAGKIAVEKDAETAFGFSFEDVLLKLEDLGISGTIMAGFDEKSFSKAVGLREGEKLACISPIGYKADRMSLKETVMRKAVGSDRRMPLEKICFKDSFERPAGEKDLGELKDLLELVRLAPSAVNKQPWRIVVRSGTVHFYEKHSGRLVDRTGWDMQKIDMGIALCHFYLGARERGIKTDCVIRDPHIAKEEDVEYIASMQLV